MDEEIMTNQQMATILKMIKSIVERSKDKEEIKEEIDKLLKDYSVQE